MRVDLFLRAELSNRDIRKNCVKISMTISFDKSANLTSV